MPVARYAEAGTAGRAPHRPARHACGPLHRRRARLPRRQDHARPATAAAGRTGMAVAVRQRARATRPALRPRHSLASAAVVGATRPRLARPRLTAARATTWTLRPTPSALGRAHV